MLDIKKIIKKTLVSTCVIFTVITAVYMLILQITNVNNAVPAAAYAVSVLLFFVFSLLLAIANMILSIKSIHGAIRYMFHYLIYIVGFCLCFCVPNGMTSAQIFVGIIFFSLGYAIVMPIVALFKRRLERNRKSQEKADQLNAKNAKGNSKKYSHGKKK